MNNFDTLVSLIRERAKDFNGVLLAYSGGIDSMLALTAAKAADVSVKAYTFTHCLQPSADLSDAIAFARAGDAEHHIIEEHPLENPEVLYNRRDRCYHCKRGLFTSLRGIADELGYLLIDGTNADDLTVYRPGRRALEELGVYSPIAECGFSKAEVREMAAQQGIAYSSKPSGSCYACRLPYNTMITQELIDMIRDSEIALEQAGFAQKRVRVHHDINGKAIARIEIEKRLFGEFMDDYAAIADAIKSFGFTYVTLDLEGWRSGSLDL